MSGRDKLLIAAICFMFSLTAWVAMMMWYATLEPLNPGAVVFFGIVFVSLTTLIASATAIGFLDE